LWLIGWAVCVGVLSFAFDAASEQRPRLIVYVHSSVKTRALENALAQRMPAVDVTVYGRYRDFARELGRVDAAMAVQPVLSAHGLPLDLKGVRGGHDTEPFVLLSIGATLERSQFKRLRVGAVDLLGRERTARFVATLLELPSPPEIKYVVKSEDLLPLLQFQSANAVLLSEAEAARLKSLSKLDLRVTRLGQSVGLAAVSFRTEQGRRVIKPSITALDVDTNRKLGIEAWR
jgi:hypothetical protein